MAYICILERRAQLWGSGVPQHLPEAASGYDMAKSWSASIVGQARIRTVKFPMYPASKPTIGDSPLALPSHIAHTL